MLKRLSALFLVFAILLPLLCCGLPAVSAEEPGRKPAASDPEPAELVRNSDAEAACDGRCWFVDTMGDGCLMVSRAETAVTCTDFAEADPEIEAVTDWPVDQVLWWEGRLLVSAGERLLTLEPESGAILSARGFDAPVDRFAVSPEGLYVLTGGEILRMKDLEGEAETLVSGAVRFWLEDPDRLSYMRDGKTVRTRTLSTGAETETADCASSLETEAGDGTRGVGLLSMKQKFPHGKFWNHMPNKGTGMAYNNQDGWTNLPCTRHNGYCGTSRQTCNGYAPNGQEVSYQCWGFADKLGHDVSGQDPQKHDTAGNGWKKLYYKDSLNSLKAGDILRYNKNGNSALAHSIYVTAVSGDTITYADCNYDGTCVIRWDQKISKSTVRNWFVFCLSAPAAAGTEDSYVLNVNARLDGHAKANTAGWAVFDVKLDGKLAETGVSEFCRTLVKGTNYEICNICPAAGICFDGTAALSGMLTAQAEVVLTLDHYYLNSAGEKVKTKLADLPAPEKWSYAPVCWALENGIACGVRKTAFAPDASCTRAQVVTFLWAAAGHPEPALETLSFRDVDPDAFYYKALCWAVEQGIAFGKSKRSFAPLEICTRAQAVTFLWAAAGQPQPEEGAACPFRDVDGSRYYYQSVLWAVEQGITAGTKPTAFSPDKNCTRAEILTFLYAASGHSIQTD